VTGGQHDFRGISVPEHRNAGLRDIHDDEDDGGMGITIERAVVRTTGHPASGSRGNSVAAHQADAAATRTGG